MCDCDCELPKRQRWAQISEEAARDAQAEIDRLKKRVDTLYREANKLDYLEAYGVDNWEGYEEAMASYREMYGDDE